MATTSGLRGTVLVLIQAILLPGTFVVTYFMATEADHVEKTLPYISDTGTYPPESGVFGLLLTLYAISAFVSVYCRWKLVNNHCTGSKAIPHFNNCGLLLGMLAAFGTLLVACFQETSQITLHMIGAFLAFILVCGYMWLQAGLTHSVTTLPGHSRWLGHIRLALAAMATLSVIVCTSLATVAENRKPANHTRTSEPGTGQWQHWMEAYDLHVVSSSFEWALAGLVSIYFLTFCSEFRHITVGMPSVMPVPAATAKDRS
ncbi:DNA damage-regulated autophagy modulator protein 2 [Elysia marginata]|uniref:DNA damage-regulated autophagy modulator protein 2 n=1 Tax=Elysia marginata TaxID=1093978 RepID=A0AAV4HG05_9GAST|nr:DNA damage-regulated autophagy modulator protein 2 [Elysia marginata]